MRRVVVTGLGIVSCIGNDADTVSANLKAGWSGIDTDEKMAELGFRSQISGRPDCDYKEIISKRSYRFMGDAAALSLCPRPCPQQSPRPLRHIIKFKA